MYIIFTNRKQEQPLHVISLGSSGTGKTPLQEKVGELIPEEDRLSLTTLSENAFITSETIKHKVILIEDLDEQKMHSIHCENYRPKTDCKNHRQ